MFQKNTLEIIGYFIWDKKIRIHITSSGDSSKILACKPETAAHMIRISCKCSMIVTKLMFTLILFSFPNKYHFEMNKPSVIIIHLDTLNILTYVYSWTLYSQKHCIFDEQRAFQFSFPYWNKAFSGYFLKEISNRRISIYTINK